MRKTLILFFSFSLISCSNNNSSSVLDEVEDQCNVESIEAEIAQVLGSTPTDTDFSYYIERADGRSFSYSVGSSTLSTTYESASTSKWVSSAIILWAVDQITGFDIIDQVSDHYAWAMLPTDPLYAANLSQLLSFTSGLQEEPACLTLGIPNKNFDDCINDNSTSASLVSVNQGRGYAPNSSFYYASGHMQVAGAMAVSAGSYSSWQQLFNNFQISTGLFQNSSYSLPRANNPRLAGGMTWTGFDYIDFLRSLYSGTLLSETNHIEMFKDQIGALPVSSSPAVSGLGEQWHYGYGVWLQCQSSVFDCSTIDYYSSPGAYGAYPFISFTHNYFGLIARQGALGTFPNGLSLFRSTEVLAEKWANCN